MSGKYIDKKSNHVLSKMKRPNTAIEEFITNYCGGDEALANDNTITLMDDLFDLGVDQDDDERPRQHHNNTNNTDSMQPQSKKSRFQLLSEADDYPFMKLVAGAMQVDTETLYEHEDVDRAIQSDYESQMATKRLLLEQENRAKKISLAEARTSELNKQLVDKDYSDMIEDKVADYAQNLDDLVSRAHGYRYENLCFEYNDYETVLGNDATPEMLISFMDRLYMEEGEEGKSFADEFKESGLRDDKLRDIAIVALWHREQKRSLPSLIDNDLIMRGDLFPSNVATKLIKVKEETDENRKVVYPVKGELSQSIYQKGMSMSNPVQERGITRKHDSYVSYMTALLNASGDITKRNELVNGVDITSIHAPELNERIKAMKNPNVATIIDTSKGFFREVYYMNSSPLQIYEGSDEDLADYRQNLSDMRSNLVKVREMYEAGIVYQLRELVQSLTTSDDTSLLVDTKKLARYEAKNIPMGMVTRDMITSTLITDSSFRDYYKKNHKETGLIDKKMDSYLCMSVLFILLKAYIPRHNSEILDKISANEKVLEQLRDEQVGPIVTRPKQGVTRSVPQIKPNVEDKIDEAYTLMTQYCPDLKGLPLAALKTRNAIEAGLAGDFARYVAALFADANLLYPQEAHHKEDRGM